MSAQENAKWTLMVYLAGDNNLSSAGEKDLSEMRSVGSTSDVNVIAEFDRIGDAHETMRYHIQRDGLNETTVSLGETDSGDPEVLCSFVDWVAERYPADRYGLVLWNHGGGWAPTEIDRIATEVQAKDYNLREATDRAATPISRALFRTTLTSVLTQSTPIDRAICCDDGSGHSLDTVELGRVLDRVTASLGQPLEFIGMDACLMSNLEVAYQCRPYAKTMVASEESEPNDGWPYGRVLKSLVTDPSQSGADLGAAIVSAYIDSYVQAKYTGAITQTALNLGAMDPLADALDRLSDALISQLPGEKFGIWSAQAAAPSFWHLTLWDLYQFCQGLVGGKVGYEIVHAAQAVQNALEAGPESFVLAESHRGSTVEGCGGASIYMPLPIPRVGISQYYGELDFSREHRWIDLLNAYHGRAAELSVGGSQGAP